MIETVTAERFDPAKPGGRTEPMHLECAKLDAQLVDVVAKITGPHCPSVGLVREVIVSLLLADLGLNVPVPLLVQFDELFLDSLRAAGRSQLAARVENSVAPGFGSTFIHATRTCTSADVAGGMEVQAAEVWAVDQLLFNYDRRAVHPNCLTDGEKIIPIDHELALDLSTMGVFCKPPWEEIPVEVAGQGQHVFRSALQGKGQALNRVEAAWQEISEPRIVAYGSCIPKSWDPGGTKSDEIVKYLLTLRGNAPAAFSNLRQALS